MRGRLAGVTAGHRLARWWENLPLRAWLPLLVCLVLVAALLLGGLRWLIDILAAA